MNRFAKRKSDKSYITRLIVPLVIFAFVIAMFVRMMVNMQSNSVQQQYEALTGALRRNIIHTYASEGFYPPSLDYLIEKYNMIINRDLFYVDYQPMGRNIMPEITVIRLN